MRVCVEGRRREEGHCAEGYVGEIFWLLLLLGCAIFWLSLRLRVGVAGVVVGGGIVEG